MARSHAFLAAVTVLAAAALAPAAQADPSGPAGPEGFVEWLVQRSVEYVDDFDAQDNLTVQVQKTEALVEDIEREASGLVVCLRSFTPWNTISTGNLVPKDVTVDPDRKTLKFIWAGVGEDQGGNIRVGDRAYEIRFDPFGMMCNAFIPDPPGKALDTVTDDSALEEMQWITRELR